MRSVFIVVDLCRPERWGRAVVGVPASLARTEAVDKLLAKAFQRDLVDLPEAIGNERENLAFFSDMKTERYTPLKLWA